MRQLLILVINIRYEAVRPWVPPQLLPPQPLLQQQLSFLGFLHLEALLDLFFLFGSVKDILDRAGRALCSAQAALNALLGIDLTEIVLNCDRALRADSCTLSASDTCDIAAFSCICALLLVVAADLDLCRFGDDLDQLLRACLSASAAACAVVASHDRYAVDDPDRVEFTSLYAVAQTDAAVRAGLAAAEQLLSCLTGVYILIFVKSGGIVGCAVAHDKRHFFLHTSGILAEQGGELLCYSGTADRALRARSVSALCHCMRVIVTSCVSAAAAVCSGELCAKVKEELVLLYREYLGCITEHTGSKETDDDDKYYRYYYIHPLPPFL